MKLKDIILDLFGSAPEPDGPRARPAPEPLAPTRPSQPPAAKPTPAPNPPPAPAPAATNPAPASTPTPAPAPAGKSEAELLAVLRRHGAPYARVRFTQNRRVMVSVGRDRSVLRMNTAFAAADEGILAAVAILYTPGAKGKRRAMAKEVVQRFINEIPASPAPPRRRRRREHPADRPHLERLRGEFDRANHAHFGGRLPRVPIHLSRNMRRRNGHFSSQPLEIVISWRLCAHGAPGEAEQTVRHEMIHLWQYIEGAPVDHGPAFRRMAHRLDVHPRATRPVKWKRP